MQCCDYIFVQIVCFSVNWLQNTQNENIRLTLSASFQMSPESRVFFFFFAQLTIKIFSILTWKWSDWGHIKAKPQMIIREMSVEISL